MTVSSRLQRKLNQFDRGGGRARPSARMKESLTPAVSLEQTTSVLGKLRGNGMGEPGTCLPEGGQSRCLEQRGSHPSSSTQMNTWLPDSDLAGWLAGAGTIPPAMYNRKSSPSSLCGGHAESTSFRNTWNVTSFRGNRDAACEEGKIMQERI